MHDRWISYASYSCEHSLCGAHLLRDCLWVVEHDKQAWAQAMHDLLLRMHRICDDFRARGAKALPQATRDELVGDYFEILRQGYQQECTPLPPATAPPQQSSSPPKKTGRSKQTDARESARCLAQTGGASARLLG